MPSSEGNPRKTNMAKVGRPPKYETAEDLQVAIEDYFENGVNKRQIKVRNGKDYEVVEIPVPTITGLVLHCGFADRASFYDLEKQDKFSHTIKKARTFIEKEYEEILQTTGNTGAIFALKNFGWKDRHEIDHSGNLPQPLLLNIVKDVPANDSPQENPQLTEAD